MDEDLPVGAFILSLIGGILILAAGIYLAIVGASLSAAGSSVLGGVAQGLGGLGAFMGLLLVILSFALFFQPEHHVGFGVAIIVLSLLSVLSGAGFILGLILGLMWHSRHSLPARRRTRTAGRPSPSLAVGTTVR